MPKTLLTHCSCLCRFRTLNTRQPFRFIYVTDIGSWSTGNFTVLATTPAIPVANPDSPFQVRMSLTNVTG